ncbi:glycoside hydrolase [Zychaea mexicana]|uniref:glycoside hydrolase n=1 Tax=Zychaea mexicana TaxID=64656 RepID=UPI0022FEAF51|nr:glycoside hydrolase [Zychaea mexicana]KAI9498280.1 glycoside hydrolase [Zychaea mexicana]
MRLLPLATTAFLLTGSTLLSSARPTTDPRTDVIVNAFKHAWNGYRQHAWGHDELRPLSNGTSDTRNGWGASIFDGLDTIIIMGLEEEYHQALEHVENVDWNSTKEPSKTFETNIRYLGGLLSAYDLRPNPIFLEKAVELAQNVILPAYDTPNGMPAAYVDVATGKPTKGKELILAEFGSLQLEMVRLSQLTGDERYAKIANDVVYAIDKVPTPFPGIYPIIWDLDTFTPSSSYITIAGGGDSYYEYLLKTYLLTNGGEGQQLDMWKKSIASMQTYLRSETSGSMVFLAEINEDYKLLQTGELVCFIPGNILLGARYLNDSDLTIFASELMKSCYDTWAVTPTGIAPETWSWIDKSQNISSYPDVMQLAMQTTGYVPQDVSYDLRPETLESIFYFYRLTGDPKYQDMAWKIFESIEKYCKTPSGYSRIDDVSKADGVQILDFEESYFFAETLKYLYLIFADPNVMSLDEWVFSTEAHPFKLNKPIKVQAQF